MPTPRSRRPTLADVAAHAGVSVATASYVLSDREGVSISSVTRDRVRDSAAHLGYRRNNLAASLRTGKSNQLAILAATRPVGAAADIVLAVAEAASARGYAPILKFGALTALEAGGYDGVIVVGHLGLDPAAYAFTSSGAPLVSIGSGIGACQLMPDDFGGARKAVEHLISLGHRRIGHLAGPQSEPSAQERLRGFLDAVHEAGLRMEASPVIHTLGELQALLQAAKHPTGLVAYDDRYALNAYRAARATGLRLPEDLSVVGFGDEAASEGYDPGLTTLRVAPELMAGAALALLEQQLQGLPVPVQTLVPTSLVVRLSSIPPA